MPGIGSSGERLIKLVKAFESDGFEIDRVATYGGRLGVKAVSKTAANYDSGLPKKAYYLEGSPYEAGFLMGSLAGAEVEKMACEFADRVIFSFIGSKTLEKIKIIQEFLIKLIYELSKNTFQSYPGEIKDEIKGLADGCKSRNRDTAVDLEHLIVLNCGIDVLCSMLYPGVFLKRGPVPVEPQDFRIPVMCNAFAVCGKSAGGGCYFARDFMFPTADVFQDAAAMVMYNPVIAGKKAIPYVSVTAPGIIGSVSAMNLDGVAFGVHMSPGANCDPNNVGINSLLLLKLCAQNCSSSDEAAGLMERTQRGVSWNYIIADGKNGRSCVAEAGASAAAVDFTRFPDEEYRKLLPGAEYLGSHGTAAFRNGIMLRWNDYKYPQEYLEFNEMLWDFYNKKHNTSKVLLPDALSEAGYINEKRGGVNCPSSFYFAPQREESDELLIATNHYIIPEMRYFAMSRWTEGLIGDRVNDIQWRYDELNSQIREMLTRKGFIDFEGAKELAGFLSPYGRNADYYSKNPRSRDGKEIRIEGCTSVFDLKNLIVESHYGYYCDKWVRLALPKYFS